MDPTEIGLFSLAEQRMKWLEARQTVLAQNIANASTPNYHSRDLPSFQATLANTGVDVDTTSPMHLQGRRSSSAGLKVPSTGRAPNGNDVAMEAQLGKVADTATAQDVVTSIYHKYQSLFRVVLGRSS